MAEVSRRLKLAAAVCAVAASVGCFSPVQEKQGSQIEPWQEKAFCEAARFCEYKREGIPAGRFFNLADEASRAIRTVKAVVSVTEKLYEPVSESSCRVTTRQNSVRWTLDFEKRRYHLERLDGDGTYVEGACSTDTCGVVRRVQSGKLLYGATVGRSSSQDIRDSVLEEETTGWWLGFLTLHREAALASAPNLGEKRFSVWYGSAPAAASVADAETVAETDIPPFGTCKVLHVTFKQLEYRDAEMWLWLASQNGWRAVRSAIYVKNTGMLLVREILRGAMFAGVYFPTYMRETVYSPPSAQQSVPLHHRRVRLALQRDIKLEKVTVNAPLGASAFRLEIPNGTLVEDRVNNQVHIKQVARPSWLPALMVGVAIMVILYIFWHLRRLLLKSGSN
ncbi:MAG: hypothetical protein HPY54_17125 [Chthonomonadetes bacterium]|nr:hypothetical protein [Chthonomonadetes bacterium]